MHPLLLAVATESWVDAGWQFAFSVAATVLVLGVVRWRSADRLSLLESNAEGVGKAMAQYRADLLQHQEDDCQQMAKIGNKIDSVNDITTRIDEGMNWLKQSTAQIHSRITEHDARNVENHKAIGKAISNLSDRTARLEGRKPATRKPSPRKRKG